MRERIERLFEQWGSLTVRWRWPLIAGAVAFVVAAGTQIPKIQLDMSVESYLPAKDPTRVTYDAFREQFGSDQQVLILLRPPEVFDLGFLEKLKALEEDLRRSTPYLDDVTSLISARHTYGTEDEFIVGELFEPWPTNEAELAEIARVEREQPL